MLAEIHKKFRDSCCFREMEIFADIYLSDLRLISAK